MRQVSEVGGRSVPLRGPATGGDREAASVAVRPRLVKTSGCRPASREPGRRFRRVAVLTLLVGLGHAGLGGPAAAGPADPPSVAPATPARFELDRAADAASAVVRSPIRRIAVVGASASDGFNCRAAVRTDAGLRMVPVDLAAVLPAAVAVPDLAVSDLADSTFFLRPVEVGRSQIDAAIACAPDLLVASDFLFWFGYGTLGVPVPPDEGDLALRLARLEGGLALLDRVDCPIVVGDLPDMSAAVGRVLWPAQMPSPAALRHLNERIAAWAAERPRVRVLALGTLVSHLRDGEALRIGALEWSARELVGTLQSDRLHPTPEGLLVLAAQVAHDAATLLGDGALPVRADAAALREAMKAALTRGTR